MALPVCLVATAAAQPASLDRTTEAVDQRLRRDVEYLSSDELEGRGLQTRGLELAAEFVAREYQAAGLKTDLYQGTPFHTFKLYSGGTSGAVQSLSLEADGREPEALARGPDYTSLMVTPAKTFQLPLAFVGYGITDPTRGYDDYAGIDVRGKAAIVLRHEPQLHRADSVFNGAEITDHSYLLNKLKNAHGHGAAAMIVCTDAASMPMPVDSPEKAAHPEPLLEAELTSGIGTESLPIVHVRRAVIARWIERSLHRSLDDIERQIDDTLKPQSADLPNQTISGRVAVVRPGRTVRNVVGVLEGTGDVADETIVVGAHYDHLGRGGWGSLAIGANDEIHNGADDNASGTAVLLEVARQLAAESRPRRRRIVFLAFAAEELGLYGSKRYVQDPLHPLDKTIAMLNLDMVGRLKNDRLTVYGTGTAKEWPDWLAETTADPPLKVRSEPSGFGPSDHAPFYERGVPVLHFFTGFHPEYHRPTDDAHRLNIPGMRRVTQLLIDMIHRLDAAPTRPQPSAVEQPFLLGGGDSINGVLSGEVIPTPPRLSVRLQPTDDQKGMRIRVVDADGVAHRAGLLAGDVLVKIAGQDTNNMETVRRILDGLEREKPVTIEFDRGGVRRTIDVTFPRARSATVAPPSELPTP